MLFFIYYSIYQLQKWMLNSSTMATNLILIVNFQRQISARCEFKDHSASVDFFLETLSNSQFSNNKWNRLQRITKKMSIGREQNLVQLIISLRTYQLKVKCHYKKTFSVKILSKKLSQIDLNYRKFYFIL